MQFVRYYFPIMFSRPPLLSSRNLSIVQMTLRYENFIKLNCQKTRNFCCAPTAKKSLAKNLSNIFSRRKYSETSVKENIKSKRKYSKSELRRILSLAKPEKWKLTGAVCLLLISSSVTMAVPFSLGKVVDIIYLNEPDKMRQNIKKLSGILIGVFLLGALCNFGRIFLMSVAGQNITKSLRQSVFTSLLKQEVGFFDRKKTGELVNRLSADTALVSSALTSNISDGLRNAIMAFSGVGIMLYMSPELAVMGVSAVAPLALMGVVYGRFVKKITKEVQDSLASATSIAEEKISNIRTVKAFAKEKQEVELYSKKLNDVLKLAYKEALARGTFFGLTGLSGNIVIIGVLYYGGVLVSENAISIGNLTSFLLYAAYIGISFNGLSTFYSELNRSLGASIRLWEIIDRVPAVPYTGGLIPDVEPKGSITFENVTFSYPSRKDEPVLKNLNLEIPQAAVTAIVGSSGSGKSTIASMLLRLYDPDEGEIILDGNKVSLLSPEWIRHHVGFVPQEPVLFSGTIRENILYGASNPSDVSEEKLIQAAQEANCFDFITKTFAEGFETIIGERGIMLSGGQKQRIAIARALIKNPKILLLDEATSALDAESEHLVQEALEKIMKERTVLIIAHRLSSIKNSDQIVVLEKGQVAEKGSYNELMQVEKGTFRKLIKHQAFS